MPLPVRLKATVSLAVVWVVVLEGSPEIDAPIGTTPPLSSPFGPVPIAGELVLRLNQSHITCASLQEVKFACATEGMNLRRGSLVELFPPGPVQTRLVVQVAFVEMMLLVKVTTEFVWKRSSFSAS